MTLAPDAHCHPGAGSSRRRFVCAARIGDWPEVTGAGDRGDAAFYGVHPFFAGEAPPAESVAESLRAVLHGHPRAGVGEIGLDRLRSKDGSGLQMPLFLAQLAVAADMGRTVALHGAKAWGETVKAAKPFAGKIPAFIFHGFSRSEGLVDEIAAMNGYFGVGAAILNSHAVNYRNLVRRLPRERLLAETDGPRPGDGAAPDIGEIVAGLAGVLGTDRMELESLLAENAARLGV